jgi:hypothetical protein
MGEVQRRRDGETKRRSGSGWSVLEASDQALNDSVTLVEHVAWDMVGEDEIEVRRELELGLEFEERAAGHAEESQEIGGGLPAEAFGDV